MLRILLVKTSSLGDVVHNFPVVSDIRRHFPDAAIDWVVEEAYVALLRLHPAVRHVIPVAMRRWRRHLLAVNTWKDVAGFRRLSRAEQYDLIIDTQGLVKSALIAHAAHGRRHGFDAASAREPIAARFYDVTHHVPKNLHAVLRNRQLVSAVLGYRLDGETDYGLAHAVRSQSGRRYCVVLHGTSRADKLWPEDAWIELAQALEARGFDCVLPWGDDSERARSERIAAQLKSPRVPERLTLDAMAALLSSSAAVVGVDTGLTHLAAALGVPVVAIYAATTPALTGVFGAPRSRNLGDAGSAPSNAEVMDALSELQVI